MDGQKAGFDLGLVKVSDKYCSTGSYVLKIFVGELVFLFCILYIYIFR